MRYILFSICLLLVTSCTEVLRQPNFDLNDTKNSKGTVTYEVAQLSVTPDVVARANQSRFTRFVNVGGSNTAPVKRVPEASLFSGRKPPANQRPTYSIGVGDTVEVTKYGYETNENGVLGRQVVRSNHLVDELGAIDLSDGHRIVVEGMTIAAATAAIRSSLGRTNTSASTDANTREFPVVQPPIYRLGIGDVVRVSRLVETSTTEGVIQDTVRTNQNSVSPNGALNILQLGEIEADGFTLDEVRDRIQHEAIGSASVLDTIVEIEQFLSKSLLVTGDLGTRIVPITDRALTYDRVIAELNPSFSGGRDYTVTLERDGVSYSMSAKDIVMSQRRDKYYALDGDRVTIKERLAESDLKVEVTSFQSRKLTYLRVSTNDDALTQQGRAVPLDLQGLDLRQLLISQGIDVTQNEDLLITINRAGKKYRLSAQSVILSNANTRYWLAPGDHVVVEDIAYVGNNALLVGEISAPSQLPVDKYQRTTLSQALFAGEAFTSREADFNHVYVLRGKDLSYVAYHFEITQVLNLSLAERFELRPGDIVFVRTRPLTRYTRALATALTFVNAIDVGITNARSFGE